MKNLFSLSQTRTAPGRQMRRRCLFLALLLGIISFSILLGKLYVLQIRDHDKYESLAIAQQLRTVNASPDRGTIYDRNMNPLAVRASVENVYLSPAEIEMYGEDRELIAKGLSEILHVDYEAVYEKTGQTGSWYVTVAKKIEKDKADEVRRFKTDNSLKGVRIESDTKSYYPNSSLACHLIGFVGTDNQGLDGIEARYDSVLSGTQGKTVRMTNAYGADLLFKQFEDQIPGESGCDLVLTLDSGIQYYVEKHLKQAVEDYDIQNGAGAIAIDPNTGEILAMASLGGYDLNNFLEISEADRAKISEEASEDIRTEMLQNARARQWRNKALSDTYEPGSTFKIITLAMALEEGAVSESSSFYCGGNVSVKGRNTPIRCWKSGGHGSQNLTQAVQHSCNVAFVNIGQRIGAETFYKYCEAFGFLNMSEDPDANLTAVTGIDLYGESGSIWWSRNVFCSERNLSQLAAASFGQTFTITPLQLVCAVSACVNGGRLMQPYVVKSIISGDGESVSNRAPNTVRQVISSQTSEKVRGILEQVVGDPKDGTGRNASVAGYRIGGKTGTSEKVSLEAQTGVKEYIVSFVGFAPADDPKIVLLVFLDTPSNSSGIYISGGQMAAPVVGKMLADILPYMGIEPDVDNTENSDSEVPRLIGLTRDEVGRAVNDAGLRYRSIGNGDKVTDQLPEAGTSIASGTEIIVYFNENVSNEMETLPDLTGMSYNEARDILSYYGIYLHTTSAVLNASEQFISSQSIRPGTKVDHGCIIDVTLIDNDDSLLGIY